MSKSKINYLNTLRFLLALFQDDHNVLRFEITMYNSHFMKMLDSKDELSDKFSGYNFLDGAMLPHVLEQILALDKFCDNVEMSLGLYTFLVEDKQGVIKNTHYAALMSTLQ